MIRKTSLVAAAGLMALGAFASPASAQINVTVNVKNTEVHADPVPGRGTGGGWGATITSASPLPTFIFGAAGGPNQALPIVYCFDFSRSFTANTNLSMTLLTFDEFIAGNPVPAINPWGNINIDDLNNMAYLASTYTPVTNTGPVRSFNAGIQDDIWDLSAGVTQAPANYADLSDSWMVLVDTQDWTGRPDGSRTNGAQSFLVRIENRSVVPEPSSFALLFAGAGVAALGLRRRSRVS